MPMKHSSPISMLPMTQLPILDAIAEDMGLRSDAAASPMVTRSNIEQNGVSIVAFRPTLAPMSRK